MLRADEQLNQLETVLAFFATFVLDSALVQEIMRWDMAVLRESPWYQEIEQRGVEKGRREELFLSIEMLLEIKFGNEGLELMRTISQVNDLERLKLFQQAIKTANTVEDLRQVL
jgi:predicted transposase YdaD